MKPLKDYIITENFVNCKSKDEMQKWGDAVWKMLEISYAYCGGIKNYSGPDQLIEDTDLWKIKKVSGKPVAVMIYSKARAGRKVALLAQDGTKVGKRELKAMMEDDFKLADRETWMGLSGMAAVTALKHGGIPVPAEIACDIMNNGGKKKCTPYDEYWYNRPIEGENHLKIMVGNPPGVEKIEAPKELIDKLIKQALDHGA